MSLESQVQDLVTQTTQLDATIHDELLDTNQDVAALRARVTALEIRAGMPDDDTGGVPGGGGTSNTNPSTNLGNDIIQIDKDNNLIWLWNPDTNSWVSIPFTEIAPPIALDVQAIIDQANNAIDDGIEARIQALADSITATVLNTQQTQIDGLAQQVTTLGTTVSGNTSAIQSEATARASADSALASQVTDLVAEVDANHQAFMTFQAAVVADPDGAAAEYLQQMQAQLNANTAAIQTEASTRATADTATASQLNTLVSSVNAAQAAVQQEVTARTSADSAISTSVTNLASRVGTAEGAIQSLQTVTSGLNSNTVQNITTLTSTVNGLTTTVQDVAQAVDGIEGKRTLAINANGRVTGIELLGGGTVGSQIKFQANNFIFYDPSTSVETVPFVISGGKSYINNAVIKDADIGTLKLAGNSVTQAVTFQGAGDTTVGSSQTTVLSGTITVSGTQPIFVNVNAFLGGVYPSNGFPNSGNNTAVGTVTLGSFTRDFLPALTVQSGILVNGHGAVVFTGVPAGTYQISAGLRCIDGSTGRLGFIVRNPSMTILETKR